jgi:uncharacterized membrane protein YeaQ/YmgE (transglycosylase-associated protein family)
MNNGLLWTIVIGIIAGWLAGQIWKGSGFGLIGDLVIGIVGAFLGGWVFGLLRIGTYGLAGQLVMSVIGALLLLLIVRLIRRA